MATCDPSHSRSAYSCFLGFDCCISFAGPEEVILDTEVGNKACAQFATHSTPACVTMKDGYFYLSLGDGAAFTTVDPGDLGHNPCGDTAPYVGGFRSQVRIRTPVAV